MAAPADEAAFLGARRASAARGAAAGDQARTRAVAVVADEESDHLAGKQRDLLEFIRSAPAALGELELARSRDTGRDVEL